MDRYELFSDNSVLFVSKDKIKRKRTVSPEWKKVQEFCAHHDVQVVTDKKTGKKKKICQGDRFVMNYSF